VLDPTFAADQYAAARAALVRAPLGFGYAREWGPGWHGPEDVDSGPIVPILQASPSSSGFALMAARAFGDDATLGALTRSLGAADLVTALDPRLAALAANPMGDVIVLHALTFGPLWQELGVGRPVVVSPSLGFAADQVQVELDRRFTPYSGVTADGREVEVGSCRERLAARDDFDSWAEYRTWDGRTAFQRCFALAALRDARRARLSHVGTFALDPGAVDQLPPTVGWRVNEDADRAAVEGEAEGRSWRQVDPSVRATADADGSLRIAGDGFWQSLTVLGRADFDGDGVEDLLIGSAQGADGGSLTVISVVVVTRLADGGPMKVVRSYATGG
jgi:hypothetical protein